MSEFWQGVIVGVGVWGILFTTLVMCVAIVQKGRKQ